MPVTKPTVIPRWATGGTAAVTEPAEGKKDTGWAVGEKPAAQYFNWLGKLTNDWLAWVNDLANQAMHWTSGHIFDAGLEANSSIATTPALSSITWPAAAVRRLVVQMATTANRVRFYVNDGGQVEFAVNASWDGTNWAPDIATSDSTVLTLGPAGLSYFRRTQNGTLTPFAPSAFVLAGSVTGGTNGAGFTGTGSGTGSGVVATAGTAATATTRQAAFKSTNGDIQFVGVANPNYNTGAKNTVTPKNICKAWASFALVQGGQNTDQTIRDGFNVSGVTVNNVGATELAVVFQPGFSMLDGNYAVFASGSDYLYQPFVKSRSGTSVILELRRLDTQAVINISTAAFTGGPTVDVLVFAPQTP
jgi:hypothetical protein